MVLRSIIVRRACRFGEMICSERYHFVFLSKLYLLCIFLYYACYPLLQKISLPSFISYCLFVAFKLCFEFYTTPIYFNYFIHFSFNKFFHLYIESLLGCLAFFFEQIIILNILWDPYFNQFYNVFHYLIHCLDVSLNFKQCHAPSGFFRSLYLVCMITFFYFKK